MSKSPTGNWSFQVRSAYGWTPEVLAMRAHCTHGRYETNRFGFVLIHSATSATSDQRGDMRKGT